MSDKTGSSGAPTRTYRSNVRAAQGIWTRRRIRAAAEELFLTNGYVATSMDAIAKAAGVSRQTVFTAFKQDTDKFAPGSEPYMFNFHVDDLAGLLAQLKSEGVQSFVMEISGAREMTQDVKETVKMYLGKSPDAKPAEKKEAEKK